MSPNGVLLQCTSYEKGCCPFVCDTDHLHSNCLDRFKNANGMSALQHLIQNPTTSIQLIVFEDNYKHGFPLCRGETTGWFVFDKARLLLDEKKRFCEEELCPFAGTYSELQKHAQLEHPHASPLRIDPARQLDWENLQQSSEMIDVLSTIHSEVLRGIVLGDYVIKYGDDESGDEFEDFRGHGNWWTSCSLYQMFDNLRLSRNRRRSIVTDARRRNRRSNYASSNSNEGSVTSVEYAEYRVDESDDEFVSTSAPFRGSFGYRRVLKVKKQDHLWTWPSNTCKLASHHQLSKKKKLTPYIYRFKKVDGKWLPFLSHRL